MKTTFSLTYSSRWGENLYLAGNQEQTGCWDVGKAVAMHYVDSDTWSVEIDVGPDLEYKYFVNDNGYIRWEFGPNRKASDKASEYHDGFRHDQFTCILSQSKLFKAISHCSERHNAESGRWKVAGLAVPLFSLRSAGSFGIGEISDLKPLADWCCECCFKIIQLLPVNDTTAWRNWGDSYPYNAISAFAINPIYLDITKLGLINSKTISAQRKKLNDMGTVDYPEVLRLKWQYFENAYSKNHEIIENTLEYINFIDQNKDWLDSYVAFCTLRDRYNTPDFSKWGEYAVYDKKKIKKFLSDNKSETGIHYFLQYHARSQMDEAIVYAHSKGIAIKGDIAIGVSPYSAEAWSLPYLFDSTMSAGAPPDAFSCDGQVWGFPTYRWDVMSKDNYSWWQKRLKNMSRHFDAYRIDHILGFFRIWEVPLCEKSGLMGHFRPALPLSEKEIEQYGFHFDKGKHVSKKSPETLFVVDPFIKNRYHPRIALQKTKIYEELDGGQKEAINRLYDDFFYHRHTCFWKDEALRKLPALLNSSSMTACGEDLGMIPDGVGEVMRQLGILSLEVQRMPKTLGKDTVEPEEAAYCSVYTTGTHDMPTLRGWLGNGCKGYESDSDQKISKIVSEALKSNAALVILPVQDFLDTDISMQSPDPADDFINDPSNAQNKWRYRMRFGLEELLNNKSLNSSLRKMIKEANR